MTPSKHEIPVLAAALGLSALLLVGGGWWLRQRGIWPGQSMGAVVNLGSRAATFEDAKDVPAGQFNYGGSTTWAPIRGEIDPLLEAAWPSFDLTYVDPANQPASTQAGLEMLLAGELDFAQSSRPLTADEQQAGLVEIPVAVEGVAIATHPNLPIDSLTLAQLKAIYTGQTTNWQAVGGPDLTVVPIARDAGGWNGTVFSNQSARRRSVCLDPTAS
ncbi:MAG: substrate-binding domain-containing protein [Cyanobacteria bacterium J06554_6]